MPKKRIESKHIKLTGNAIKHSESHIVVEPDQYAITGKGAEAKELVTFGADSCAILALYSKDKKIGALAHILSKSPMDIRLDVEQIIYDMKKLGAKKIKAFISGGQPYNEREIKIIKNTLKNHGVDIEHDFTIKDEYRAVHFNAEKGEISELYGIIPGKIDSKRLEFKALFAGVASAFGPEMRAGIDRLLHPKTLLKGD